MKKYQISELARYRGITANGVVFMEKQGVISSRRDPHNGYRYFDENAFSALSTVATYQKAGFSLKQAQTLLKSDVQAVGSALQTQRTELEREYRERLATITQIEKLNAICQTPADVIERVARPALWLLPIAPPLASDFAEADRDTWKAWENANNDWDTHMPFVQYGIRFGTPADGIRFERCSIVEAADAERLRLCEPPFVERLPSAECLHTIIHVYTAREDVRTIDPLLAYLQAKELTLSGPIVGRVLFLHTAAQDLDSFTEVWAPIADA